MQTAIKPSLTRARLPGEGPAARRGVVFAVSTIQSIMSGRKTQARRLVNPQPDESGAWKGRCPYGAPGSRLWIREMWKAVPDGSFLYGADFTREQRRRMRPWEMPLFMPREAARLFADVVDIRMQPVQSISEEDALAEGVPTRGVDFLGPPDPYTDEAMAYPTAVDAFAAWWDHAHGAGAWDRNEWVWAIDFRLVP